jgi:TPR repeat protein
MGDQEHVTGIEGDELHDVLKRARGLYTQAAEKDHSDAAVNLAAMWNEGRGGPQSSSQTQIWLTKAAKQVT